MSGTILCECRITVDESAFCAWLPAFHVPALPFAMYGRRITQHGVVLAWG